MTMSLRDGMALDRDNSRLARMLAVLTCLIVTPAVVFAQASIAGVVKDTSGAVLPGVTVEASSEALIEKTRSVVTDGTGQYKIVDLRPGAYAVTFTLAGFGTIKREGTELTGSLTALVNVELRVGQVQETSTSQAKRRWWTSRARRAGRWSITQLLFPARFH